MKYNIGDKVWYATYETRSKEIVCPDCLGKKHLTVIMGDGSKVRVDCTGCESGLKGSLGYNTVYEGTAVAELRIIDGIELKDGKIRYKSQHYILDEDRVFDKKEDAAKKGQELAEKSLEDQMKHLNGKKESKYEHRTWAWNATYHRRELKRAEKNVIYHRTKLDLSIAKSKGGK